MKKLVFLGLCALASCGNLRDTRTAFGVVQSTYLGAATAEMVYAQSGKADKALLASIERARLAAWAALSPINAEIAAGQAPSSDLVLAAQTAVSAFETLVPQGSK